LAQINPKFGAISKLVLKEVQAVVVHTVIQNNSSLLSTRVTLCEILVIRGSFY